MPGTKRFRSGLKRTDSLAIGGARNKTGSRYRNKRVSVPRNKLAFPQQLKTKLRYVVRKEFDLTSGNIVTGTMRANDLYDPEYTVGGHQPRGFDEMMAVYQTFTVTGSTCSASFMYEGYMGPSEVENGALVQTVGGSVGNLTTRTPALPPVACGIHKGIETLSAGSAADQMEKDCTKWRFMTPENGVSQVRTSLKCSDFFGKKSLIGAEGYSGEAQKSPTEQIFFEVWAGRLDNNTNMSAANVRVPVYIVVEYDCVFTDPKTLDSS